MANANGVVADLVEVKDLRSCERFVIGIAEGEKELLQPRDSLSIGPLYCPGCALIRAAPFSHSHVEVSIIANLCHDPVGEFVEPKHSFLRSAAGTRFWQELTSVLPVMQQAYEEIIPVAEVVVEAAARHSEVGGKTIYLDASMTLLNESFPCRIDPLLSKRLWERIGHTEMALADHCSKHNLRRAQIPTWKAPGADVRNVVADLERGLQTNADLPRFRIHWLEVAAKLRVHDFRFVSQIVGVDVGFIFLV